MAIYGVSITKKVLFRNFQQEFSNVYHYDFPSIIGGADGDSLIDNIKAIEAGLHSVDVTFVLGRVWSAGGSAGSNQMISEKVLSGTGTGTAGINMDRERAVLCQWPAGFNSLGRPVFLRKWYHSCGVIAGVSFANNVLQQTAEISSTDRATIAAAVDNLESVNAGSNTGTLKARSGRTISGPLAVYRWLEHHQLGDQWRA